MLASGFKDEGLGSGAHFWVGVVLCFSRIHVFRVP